MFPTNLTSTLTTQMHTHACVLQEGLVFKGFAKVFDGEESMLEALSKDKDSFKGSVVVIR